MVENIVFTGWIGFIVQCVVYGTTVLAICEHYACPSGINTLYTLCTRICKPCKILFFFADAYY